MPFGGLNQSGRHLRPLLLDPRIEVGDLQHLIGRQRKPRAVAGLRDPNPGEGLFTPKHRIPACALSVVRQAVGSLVQPCVQQAI